ncbi:hypothetical protein [Uliginosibacterium sediminicola]|uniref:Uncharacterized protein n=1 Tax=Uliginosibacterium sediminicola TaxID=2024550 RepID=A0ABU9YZF4_9RHOO
MLALAAIPFSQAMRMFDALGFEPQDAKEKQRPAKENDFGLLCGTAVFLCVLCVENPSPKNEYVLAEGQCRTGWILRVWQRAFSDRNRFSGMIWPAN